MVFSDIIMEKFAGPLLLSDLASSSCFQYFKNIAIPDAFFLQKKKVS